MITSIGVADVQQCLLLLTLSILKAVANTPLSCYPAGSSRPALKPELPDPSTLPASNRLGSDTLAEFRLFVDRFFKGIKVRIPPF